MDERQLKTRIEKEEASQRLRGPGATDCSPGFAGVTGAAPTQAECSGNYSHSRWLLEMRRDEHRRAADGLQALLDALPAKMPSEAEHALARLTLK